MPSCESSSFDDISCLDGTCSNRFLLFFFSSHFQSIFYIIDVIFVWFFPKSYFQLDDGLDAKGFGKRPVCDIMENLFFVECAKDLTDCFFGCIAEFFFPLEFDQQW